MLLEAYYHLKPFIPRRAQLTIRRYVMARRRAKCGDIWPIDARSGNPPPGWKGWPEGKRFALVLTHDVEGQAGLDRCLALADIEERMGFRSSFNFVAEDYSISPDLRATLGRRGFEVGVHGISHDGHLYSSQAHFMRQAAKINGYLKQWQSVGFRSPAMHRNFEWLGELDILYDASSFDTDPFEPYPQGAGTIFPFHVRSATAQRRYVELPYTLPQDFTLFVVFREQDTEIWRRKLDWIAERGGMALVITHPDYMAFPGTRARFEEYSVARYEELLQYVQDRHSDGVWPALPREIARYWDCAYGSGVER